jgi:hypothetical protein
MLNNKRRREGKDRRRHTCTWRKREERRIGEGEKEREKRKKAEDLGRGEKLHKKR